MAQQLQAGRTSRSMKLPGCTPLRERILPCTLTARSEGFRPALLFWPSPGACEPANSVLSIHEFLNNANDAVCRPRIPAWPVMRCLGLSSMAHVLLRQPHPTCSLSYLQRCSNAHVCQEQDTGKYLHMTHLGVGSV